MVTTTTPEVTTTTPVATTTTPAATTTTPEVTTTTPEVTTTTPVVTTTTPQVTTTTPAATTTTVEPTTTTPEVTTTTPAITTTTPAVTTTPEVTTTTPEVTTTTPVATTTTPEITTTSPPPTTTTPEVTTTTPEVTTTTPEVTTTPSPTTTPEVTTTTPEVTTTTPESTTTTTEAPSLSVIPILHCQEWSAGCLCSWGYDNMNEIAIFIAEDGNNHIAPHEMNIHPPTTFHPGYHEYVFNTTHICNQSTPLLWILCYPTDCISAVCGALSPQCSVPTTPPVPEISILYVDDMLNDIYAAEESPPYLEGSTVYSKISLVAGCEFEKPHVTRIALCYATNNVNLLPYDVYAPNTTGCRTDGAAVETVLLYDESLVFTNDALNFTLVDNNCYTKASWTPWIYQAPTSPLILEYTVEVVSVDLVALGDEPPPHYHPYGYYYVNCNDTYFWDPLSEACVSVNIVSVATTFQILAWVFGSLLAFSLLLFCGYLYCLPALSRYRKRRRVKKPNREAILIIAGPQSQLHVVERLAELTPKRRASSDGSERITSTFF